MDTSLQDPIQVRLRGDQLENLESVGLRTDRPRSWLIRRAIDEYLERRFGVAAEAVADAGVRVGA